MSRSWANFDESKRDVGPLAYGSNQTAAFLAQFCNVLLGIYAVCQENKNQNIMLRTGVGHAGLQPCTRSRARGYLAVLFSVLVLGLLKDRKLLLVLGIFLLTWQTVVPAPVRERVTMTENSNGQLEASAQERVDLWQNAEKSILHSPIVGTGYATFQLGEHVDNLKDTHNWYVKVMVETGIHRLIIAFILLQQLLAMSYRLFKRATDPPLSGLGLGLLLATCSCRLFQTYLATGWTYLEITGLLWDTRWQPRFAQPISWNWINCTASRG